MVRSKKPVKKAITYRLKSGVDVINNRRQEFLARRPHRSFRLTKRRAYVRSLKLPGYIAFTAYVAKMLFKHRRVLLSLVLIYASLMVLLSSFMDQETYASLKELVDTANEGGALGVITPMATLVWGVVGAQLSVADATQQVVVVLVSLFVWLSTVWLLRSILAGGKPKARDAVYSSGGPVIALLLLGIVLMIQFIPAALAIIVYNAAVTTGLFDQTVLLMLFGMISILLVTLSIYWATSTLIAMVVVTLPGMYPLRALRLAGDVVVGRRIRLLLRFSWMIGVVALVWIIVLIPVILIDSALKSAVPGLAWLPIVPIIALFLSAVSIVVMAGYVYLLYRKVVDDDSAPA